MKKLVMAAFMALSFLAAKADDGQKISSKVQKVVVFLNGAQVNRTATVSISPGTATLVFGNISPDLDAQSIQVHAMGDFTILSVNHELNYLNEDVNDKKIADLRIQQKLITDKMEIQNELKAVYDKEEQMLDKNQVVSNQTVSLDVIKLKQALDFQTERLTFLKRKQQEIRNEVMALSAELQKYNNQINELNQGSNIATTNILVTVSSRIQTQAIFTLSYLVKNARWYPTYDIRAKNVNSPISIDYKANVSQHSGEDWKNVKLTLSTGNPSVSGSKPDLSPYYLNFGMIYSDQVSKITRVTGRVIGRDDGLAIPGASVNVKGTSIGTQTDGQGNYSLQIPPGNHPLVYRFIGYKTLEQVISAPTIDAVMASDFTELNEVVVTGAGVSGDYSGYPGAAAGVSIRRKARLADEIAAKSIPVLVNKTENQTNFEFNIDNPYSIPSDGKQYTVEINQIEVNASYEYAVAPKLSTDVFLTAKLTDWNKYNFLSGEANLFFEGTFIGKSLMNTDATADTLNLSLGTDKNIVVTRTSLKDFKDKQNLGSNKKETRDWQIEIKNRKNQAVNLLVEDQVPVSQNSSIEVETQELSGGKLDVPSGKITWNIALKPLDDKKLELKYQVRYPKNQSVIVQ